MDATSTPTREWSNLTQFHRWLDSSEHTPSKPPETEEQSFSFSEYVAAHPKNLSLHTASDGESLENVMTGRIVPIQWTHKDSGLTATQVVLGAKKREIVRYHKLLVVMVEDTLGNRWFEMDILDEDTFEYPFSTHRMTWLDESLPATLKRFRKVTKRLQKVKK